MGDGHPNASCVTGGDRAGSDREITSGAAATLVRARPEELRLTGASPYRHHVFAIWPGVSGDTTATRAR